MYASFVEVNGIPTRYLWAGKPDSTPLLMVHGRILTAEHWYKNIDALGAHFFVVAPDVLGNGFTGPVDFAGGPHPVQQRYEHLAALVDVLGFREFYACGSSHGALLSTLLHFRMPDRLTKLVINGSAAFASPDVLAKSVDRTLERDDPAIGRLSPEGWHAWMSAYVHDPRSLPPEVFPTVMTAYAQNWVMDCWRKSLLGHREMHQRPDLTIEHRLSDITADTLLIWGRNDWSAPLDDAMRMHAGIRRSRLEIFDDCAHMPMMEHPERYNRMLATFLTASDGAA